MINDNDFFRGLYQKSLLPVREYIFYIRDHLTVQPFFEKFGPRCEMEMIRKADLVVANSALACSIMRANGIRIVWISARVVKLDAFIAGGSAGTRRSWMAFPGPIIGYCGAITSMRLDEVSAFAYCCQIPCPK